MTKMNTFSQLQQDESNYQSVWTMEIRQPKNLSWKHILFPEKKKTQQVRTIKTTRKHDVTLAENDRNLFQHFSSLPSFSIIFSYSHLTSGEAKAPVWKLCRTCGRSSARTWKSVCTKCVARRKHIWIVPNMLLLRMTPC